MQKWKRFNMIKCGNSENFGQKCINIFTTSMVFLFSTIKLFCCLAVDDINDKNVIFREMYNKFVEINV